MEDKFRFSQSSSTHLPLVEVNQAILAWSFINFLMVDFSERFFCVNVTPMLCGEQSETLMRYHLLDWNYNKPNLPGK